MEVTTVQLDLGKDVFQVHGITSDGTVVFNRTIRRKQLPKFFEKLPSCLVGIEACGSARHWARELAELVMMCGSCLQPTSSRMSNAAKPMLLMQRRFARPSRDPRCDLSL